MRRAALASAALHLALLAWLLHGLAQAGGAPMLGDGGGASFEVMMVASAAGGSPADAEPAADSVFTAPPPAPKPGPEAERYLAAAAAALATAEAEAAIAATPAPPVRPLPQATDAIPAPLGEEAIVPPTAALVPPEAEPALQPATAREPPLSESAGPLPDPAQEPTVDEAAVEPVQDAPAEVLEQPQEAGAPEEPLEERVESVAAPPLKPLKDVVLPEPRKEIAQKAAEQRTATTQQASADPTAAEPAASDTELAALPSPGSSATAAEGSKAPGSPDAPQVGLSPGQLQDYGQLLVAWLDRHKRYPDQARKRRQEAVVTVEIVVDGEGRLLSHRLIGASGVASLDAEAAALPSRASPFPKPPGGGQHAFQVPIVFMLR